MPQGSVRGVRQGQLPEVRNRAEKRTSDETLVSHPCKPLFRPVWVFGRRGDIRVPLGGIKPCVAACAKGCRRHMKNERIAAGNGDKSLANSLKNVGFPVVPAGSKCVQVKGRVALKSPLARFTPPGKAVREKHLAPGKTGGWKTERAGYKKNGQVA